MKVKILKSMSGEVQGRPHGFEVSAAAVAVSVDKRKQYQLYYIHQELITFTNPTN